MLGLVNQKRFDNNALLPYALYSEVVPQNPFGYLEGTASILRGGVGSITLTLSNPVGKEVFDQKPNYIGDNLPDDKSDGVSYTFGSRDGEYQIQLKVSAIGGNEQLIYICIDTSCINYSKEIDSYKFSVHNPKRLYIKSDQDVGYVVLSSIDWNKVK